MKEIDPGSGFVDILANGLIGGGISLITGMVGGPILGAAAGSAVSIIKQSKTAQNSYLVKILMEKDREELFPNL